jgi:uncharacterized RDD family membrane protein YckC
VCGFAVNFVAVRRQKTRQRCAPGVFRDDINTIGVGKMNHPVFKNILTSHTKRRFLAFVIDIAFVLIVLSISYSVFKIPDYPALRVAMDQHAAVIGTAQEQEAVTRVFDIFSSAYTYSLLVYFGYEILCAVIFKGATAGKRICGLKIRAAKATDGKIKTAVRIALRSVLKMLFIYLFNGFPFLISCLTIFPNPDNRSGTDIITGTTVVNSTVHTRIID